MIASPGDIIEARDAVERAIHGWNDANALNKEVILQPWRWETSAVPVLGDRPQALINAQGVDDSDIVFALFGSRLGSPTSEAVSGTLEEIERALAQGKPVHLYFSTSPLPNDVDLAQLEGLREFRQAMQDRGLLGEFSNPSQLGHEVWKAIEHDIAKLDFVNTAERRAANTPVQFLVQPREEREVAGFKKNGSPRYTTRRWLEVTNTGVEDAEHVTFESIGDSGLHLGVNEAATTIHPGQTRTLHVSYMFGGDADPVLRINWHEGDEEKSADFHVG